MEILPTNWQTAINIFLPLRFPTMYSSKKDLAGTIIGKSTEKQYYINGIYISILFWRT